MYKLDLALNNQQWLICYKTKLKQETKREQIDIVITSILWINM